ncbi:MAG: type II secretion system F family protein [Rubrivivax sp.]
MIEAAKAGERMWRVRRVDLAAARLDACTIGAESAQAAAAQAARPPWVVLGVTELAPEAGRPSGAAPGFDVAWWCEELKTLLAAGMTVIEALDALAAEAQAPGRRQVLERLGGQLAAGKPLSVAMEGTGVFPPVLLSGVVAGERSGELASALQDYLDYHRLVDRLQAKLRSAAVYPALVSGVGVLVVGLLLVFVMPRFALIYRDRPELQASLSGTLLALSVWLSAHRLAALGVLAAAIGAAGLAARQAAVRDRVVSALESMAPVRQQLDEFRKAKLFKSLAVMVRGGYTLEESLGRCQGLKLGPRFECSVAAAREAVVRGKPPAEAFAASDLTDAVTERLLRVAERTGQIVPILQTLAERHADRFSAAVDRLARLAEPLLLLLVSLAVGTVVVLMYLPIFDLAGGLR